MEELEFRVEQAAEGGTIDYDQPIPDDTMCTATLMMTEPIERTFTDAPAPVRRLRWKFRIDEPEDYRDRYVWGESGVKVANHPSCRIYSWAQAVLGINPLPLDYGFRQSDLADKQVRVLVATRVGKDRKTGEERTYNYVEDVLPIGGVARPAPYLDDDF